MKVTRRPMRPEEADELGVPASYHWRFHGLGFALFSGGAVAAVVGVTLQLVGIRDGRQLAIFIATFVIATALIWGQHQRRFGAIYRTAARQNQAARSGEVEEWRLKITDAIEVEEESDLGSNYYLGLEDGRVLFLSGQYLYEYEESGRFPNRELVLVRLPDSGSILDLRCEGEPFAASGKLSAFTRAQYQAAEVPVDGDVLEGPLSRFRGSASSSTSQR